jgi:hypothetical protein
MTDRKSGLCVWGGKNYTPTPSKVLHRPEKELESLLTQLTKLEVFVASEEELGKHEWNRETSFRLLRDQMVRTCVFISSVFMTVTYLGGELESYFALLKMLSDLFDESGAQYA